MDTAFAFVRPETVIIARDPRWNQIFREGSIMLIAGGTKAKFIDESPLETIIQLDDPYYPPVKCRVSKMRKEHENLLTPVHPWQDGDPHRYAVEDCDHRYRDIKCRSCWVKFWRQQAASLGLVVPHISVPFGRDPWGK